MDSGIVKLIGVGILQTLYMTLGSALLAYLIGLPVGVVLYATDRGGVWENRIVNRVLGILVNFLRSVPFIILLIWVLPVTRAIVGTSIGLWAAVVPLSIAATPFFARIAEVSLREVDHGLVEAAQAMGASRWQIIVHVLLPEALPGIIRGFTITVVSMIGSSAMAGAVGAGGLGDLAMRYGYQRFDTTVMVSVIAVLIVIVTVVQSTGDLIASRFDRR